MGEYLHFNPSPRKRMSLFHKERRDLISAAKIYGLGSIINRAAGFILIPLYTHVLTPEEFGIYALIVVTAELSGILLSRGFSTAMIRVYIDCESDIDRAKVASTAFIGFSILSLLIALFVPLLSDGINPLLFDSADHSTIISLAIFGVIATLIFNFQLDYYRVNKKPWTYLWISTAKSFLMFAINILLVAYFELGVFGIVLGTLLASLFIIVPILIHLLRQLGIHFLIDKFKEMLKLGLPMLPSRAADAATQFTDKYFINLFFTTAMVGYYTLALRVSSLIHILIVSPFAQIWIVRRLETLKTSEGQSELNRIFSQFFALLTASALFFSLYSPEIITLIASDEYLDAIVIIPILCVASILMPIDMNFQLGMLHAKKTHLIMGISIIAGIANVPLMYFLVSSYGAIGAAVALILTNTVRVIVSALFNHYYCDSGLRFEWGRAIALFIIATVLYLIAYQLYEQDVSLTGIFVKFILLIAFCIPAYLLTSWSPKSKNA